MRSAVVPATGLDAAALLRSRSTDELSSTFSSQPGAYSVNLNGDPELGYFLQISLGTPKTYFNVLVDTGSSNFAIAGYKDQCVNSYFNSSQSSSFRSKGLTFTVHYTEGLWNGLLGSDAVGLATLLPQAANLSVISHSEKLFICSSGWQGILGLAFQAISLPAGNIKPFFDELVSAGRVADVFSLQLCLKSSWDNTTNANASGHAVFGGVDAALYDGAFHDVALIAKRYYEVLITDILVQNRSLGFDCKEYNTKRTIVDSGTTNIMLPSKVHAELTSYLRNLVKLSASIPPGFWTGLEAACWPSGPYPDWLPTLTLRLLANDTHVVVLDLAPGQYLLKTTTNGTRLPNMDCFKLAISVAGDMTIIGAQSMTAYYVSFDRAGQQVGFARSTCLNGTATSGVQSRVSWYPNAGFSVASCAFDEYAGKGEPTSMTVIVACVVLAVLVSVLIAFIATKLRRQLALRGTAGNIRVQLVNEIDPDT